MTLKDNCMCLEDLEQRTARIKMSEETDTAVSPRLLAVSQPEPWTSSSVDGRRCSPFIQEPWWGYDSLSLKMAGLNKDHGEKDKTSESSYGTQEVVARTLSLASLSPERGTGIKRFTLLELITLGCAPKWKQFWQAIIRCLFSSQLSNISRFSVK